VVSSMFQPIYPGKEHDLIGKSLGGNTSQSSRDGKEKNP
jgi:hypothetical protein